MEDLHMNIVILGLFLPPNVFANFELYTIELMAPPPPPRGTLGVRMVGRPSKF